MQTRYQLPDDPSEAFFSSPSDERLAELCSSRLFERYKDNWRTQRQVSSVALSSDNPMILDNGRERALHDGLISSSFGFHPSFGTGHVLRTNGVICMFWNGEEVAIVELKNVTKLPVLLCGERKTKTFERAKRLASAMLED